MEDGTRRCRDCGIALVKKPGPGRWPHWCDACTARPGRVTPRPRSANCTTCGAVIGVSTSGPIPRYCSSVCREKARSVREGRGPAKPARPILTLQCWQCAQPFKTKDASRRYCSRECAGLAKRRHDPDTETIECRQCWLTLPSGHFFKKSNGIRKTTCNTCRRKRRGARAAPRECAHCGKIFRPKQQKHATYCSRECGWQGQARIRAETVWLGKFSPLPWKSCRQCGAEFYARGTARTCSDACRAARRYQKRSGDTRTVACSECGQSFTYVRYNRERVTCSDRCRCRRANRINPEGRRATKARREAIIRGQLEAGAAEHIVSRRVFIRDRWLCWLCGGALARSEKVPHPKAPTIDHVIPLSKQGPHTYENVRAAHFICNSLRGANDPTAPMMSLQMALI